MYEEEGNLFFNDFTQYAAKDRLKSFDRKFQLLTSFPQVLAARRMVAQCICTSRACDTLASKRCAACYRLNMACGPARRALRK